MAQERQVDTGTTAPTGQDGRHRRRIPASGELKSTPWELYMLLLSGLTILNSVIVLLPLDRTAQQVAFLTDVILAPMFFGDFLVRLATAEHRRRYVLRQFGWADFLASFPFLGGFRIFRSVRTIRLLRAYGGDRIAADLDRDRARMTFLFTVFMVLVVVEFAGMAIYAVESPVAAGNIKTPSDAIWWGFVTITTVGYGDRYPVTNEGRIIGGFLLFAGIALFSVLTGFIANAFLAPRAGRRFRRPPEGTLQADMDELRGLLLEQEQRATVIRLKLDEIERKARRRMRDASTAVVDHRATARPDDGDPDHVGEVLLRPDDPGPD